MGKMALGYGSEFHLLRWLGRHRNDFDSRVKRALQVDNITWLDFDFCENRTIPDQELVGVSFLKEEPNFKSVISKWEEEWPKTGTSMNWDLVGHTTNNGIKTWILVEAKAHMGELTQNCGAKPKSFAKIERALINAAVRNGVTIVENKSWTKNYYQLANRIYVLDLLNRCGIDATLLNIYFIGDLASKSRKSPQSQATWETEIAKMKNHLNLETCTSIEIKDLFLDVNK